MASQEENRAKGNGFGGASRPQRPTAGQNAVPLSDVGDAYGAAPDLGQSAEGAAYDANAIAMLWGGMAVVQQKAAEVQGKQAVLEAVQEFNRSGKLPDDPMLAGLVQQYVSYEQVSLQMQGDLGFFTRRGDTVVLNALPKLGPTSFSQAAEALGKSPSRFALPQGNQQQTLPGGN